MKSKKHNEALFWKLIKLVDKVECRKDMAIMSMTISIRDYIRDPPPMTNITHNKLQKEFHLLESRKTVI